MGVHPHGDQVHAVGAEGPTTQEPASGQGEAPPEPVGGERLNGIVGAARVEPAGGHAPRCSALIGREERHGHADRSAQGGNRPAHALTALRPARASAPTTSARNSAGASSAAPGSSRTKYDPRGRRWASDRTTARARRRSEFRTTAPPQRRPIAYPTWGNTPGSLSSAGTKAALTGPQAPRARERCSSAKTARLVIRPTVRAGTLRLQTVRRWRPLSRRDFKMARPARVDMRLRNPWVRARFRVLGW